MLSIVPAHRVRTSGFGAGSSWSRSSWRRARETSVLIRLTMNCLWFASARHGEICIDRSGSDVGGGGGGGGGGGSQSGFVAGLDFDTAAAVPGASAAMTTVSAASVQYFHPMLVITTSWECGDFSRMFPTAGSQVLSAGWASGQKSFGGGQYERVARPLDGPPADRVDRSVRRRHERLVRFMLKSPRLRGVAFAHLRTARTGSGQF